MTVERRAVSLHAPHCYSPGSIAHREANPLPSLMVSVYAHVKVLELRGELTRGRGSMQGNFQHKGKLGDSSGELG